MSKPKRKRDWIGRYVRLLAKQKNGFGAIFEAGEVMYVDRNHGGLHLSAVIRCQHCARRHHYSITRVPETDVELLPVDYQPAIHKPI